MALLITLMPLLQTLAAIIVPLILEHLEKPKQVKFYALDPNREKDITGSIDAVRRRLQPDTN